MVNDISGNAAADIMDEDSWSSGYGVMYNDRTEAADGFRSLIDGTGSGYIPGREMQNIYDDH